MSDQRGRDNGASGLAGLVGALRNLSYAGSAYRFPLSGRIPERLLRQPVDLTPGDAERGKALLDGIYQFAGQVIHADGDAPAMPPWRNREAGDFWLRGLQEFGWLRDLKAVATQSAQEHAQALVADWMERHTAIDAVAWRPEFTGLRLSAWLAHAEFILKDADEAFVRRFYQNLALHLRHLTRTARGGEDGAARIAACKGLIYGGLCLPESERRYLTGLKILENEVTRQVAADGGQVERNPSSHVAVLRDLVEIRATLTGADQAVPEFVPNAIERMAPVLRAYRHGDGALTLMNGGIEEEPWMIDLILARADARGRAQLNAPETGYRRVQASRTVLLIDTGPPQKITRFAHAGALGFELSVGKERMIVNCGTWRGGEPAWRNALRATAAHSTLTVDDTNSAELHDDGRLGEGPGEVFVEREDQDGATWIDARHDGYLAPFGLVHQRRFYISPDGNDIRGEDVLSRAEPRVQGGRSLALRFHLHPDVQSSLVQDSSAVLLRLPSGAGWQMRASGGVIDLNESVYAGDGTTRRRTEQIVITAPIKSDHTTVKWALRRIPKN